MLGTLSGERCEARAPTFWTPQRGETFRISTIKMSTRSLVPGVSLEARDQGFYTAIVTLVQRTFVVTRQTSTLATLQVQTDIFAFNLGKNKNLRYFQFWGHQTANC